MAKILTAKAIETAKPGPLPREIPDGAAPGLHLIVYPSGQKGWTLRYRRKSDGRTRKLTLGSLHVPEKKAQPREDIKIGQPLSLAEARKLAADQRHRVALGHDPAAEKRDARRAAREGEGGDRDLFKNVVADFLRRHASKNRSAQETERLFRKEVLPGWGNRRIQEITKRDVIELIERIDDSGRGITANRTLAAIRKLFNWAVGRDILVLSPCAGVKPPAAETHRDRVLTDDEIRWLWKACDTAGGAFGAVARLLLVTAQRKEEVGALTYPELILDDPEPSWTIPGERAKNGREQFVPLPDLAVQIIKSLPRIKGRFVFTTTGETPVSGYSRAKVNLDREMLRIAREETGDSTLEIPHWTFHDLRRTAATGMQRLGFPIEVVDAVLNHKSGAVRGVAAIYGRHKYKDEKKGALVAWSDGLERLLAGKCFIAGAQATNVVMLQARA